MQKEFMSLQLRRQCSNKIQSSGLVGNKLYIYCPSLNCYNLLKSSLSHQVHVISLVAQLGSYKVFCIGPVNV